MDYSTKKRRKNKGGDDVATLYKRVTLSFTNLFMVELNLYIIWTNFEIFFLCSKMIPSTEIMINGRHALMLVTLL